jgi:hypothetical protein
VQLRTSSRGGKNGTVASASTPTSRSAIAMVLRQRACSALACSSCAGVSAWASARLARTRELSMSRRAGSASRARLDTAASASIITSHVLLAEFQPGRSTSITSMPHRASAVPTAASMTGSTSTPASLIRPIRVAAAPSTEKPGSSSARPAATPATSRPSGRSCPCSAPAATRRPAGSGRAWSSAR